MGDQKAFSRLVQLHQAKLRSFLLRLCQNPDLCDDLAQDTFVRCFKKLDSYSGAGSFSGWLFQIAYRVFLEHRRRENRRSEVTLDYFQQAELLLDTCDAIDDQQLDLEKAMLALTVDERAAVSLCHSYGFSHPEAAAILELPVGTVKTRIHSGKEKLRLQLNQQQVKSKSL